MQTAFRDATMSITQVSNSSIGLQRNEYLSKVTSILDTLQP
jgi:hypothetical protein